MAFSTESAVNTVAVSSAAGSTEDEEGAAVASSQLSFGLREAGDRDPPPPESKSTWGTPSVELVEAGRGAMGSMGGGIPAARSSVLSSPPPSSDDDPGLVRPDEEAAEVGGLPATDLSRLTADEAEGAAFAAAASA